MSKKSQSFLKFQQEKAKALRQKEETIQTVLVTAKNNPNFVKLLIYTLNSLEGFLTPPNREIRTNAGIIIRLDGVEILHKITMKNITKEDVVSKAADILWKLLSVYDKIDYDLAKLLAEKDGHKAIIEILLLRQQNNANDGSIAFIRILNGLAQIPQLIPMLLQGGIADTLKVKGIEENTEAINLNLDTIKKISGQKIGREYLLSKDFVKEIFEYLNISIQKKDANGVLCSLAVLDNLTRSPEGIKAVRDANGILMLTNVLDSFPGHDYIMKKCAKIYSKIATEEDMKNQLELLQSYYSMFKAGGEGAIKFTDVNKCLILIYNLMLVNELGNQVLEPENLNLVCDFYNLIQEFNSNDIHYLLMNKYMLQIFSRIFEIKPDFLNKNTEVFNQNKPLLIGIKNNIHIIYGKYKALLNSNAEIADIFCGYFVAYSNIFDKFYNFNIDFDNFNFIETLKFILQNILKFGKNIFKNDEMSNNSASKILKFADIINIEALTKVLLECYDYILYLFSNLDDNTTLSNALDIIYDLLITQPDFKAQKFDEIIIALSKFMENKKEKRYPCLIAFKILDLYLTKEYLDGYLKMNNPLSCPTHSIDFLKCIVEIMTFKSDIEINKPVEGYNKGGFLNLIMMSAKKVESNTEEEINTVGSNLLSKLVDEKRFNDIVAEFQDNVTKFDPKNADPALVTKLYGNITILQSLMNIKTFNIKGAETILISLRLLIEKEIKFIEFYKSDKSNKKNKDYDLVLLNSSKRLKKEMSLVYKINLVSLSVNKMDNYSKTLDIIFFFLSKSSDMENVHDSILFLDGNINDIDNNQNTIYLENKENVLEKTTNVIVALFRKTSEDDKTVSFILSILINLAKLKNQLCNLMVKGGILRLLFQVIETSPEEKNIENALSLMELIALSNEENLKMIANQNALVIFFDVKVKNANNNTIIRKCDLISNEILKLPAQEGNALEFLEEAIADFNKNSSLDPTKLDTNEKLSNNLDVINAFTTNKVQCDRLNNEEFIKNFKALTDRTLNDNSASQLTEKLLTNEISILSKLKKLPNFDEEYNAVKLMQVIKNKSQYRDILLKSAEEFAYIVQNEESYDKLLKDKIDNSFIDSIFEANDNYLDDIAITKELNNILCYLCLRNKEFAQYIKSKGGFANILEELKSIVNRNDPNSQQIKLNSLKMLEFLCSDKDGMDMFLKANGKDLLQRIVDNEVNLNKSIIDSEIGINLFKTKDIISFQKKAAFNFKALIANVASQNESYFVYCVKIIKNAFDLGYNDLADDKTLKNLMLLSLVMYPKRDLFDIILELILNGHIAMPKEQINKFTLLKCCITFKTKYPNEKALCQKIDQILNEKLIEDLKGNKEFNEKLCESLKQNPSDKLELTFFDQFILQNDNYSNILKIAILSELSEFVCEMFNTKASAKEMEAGVLISLMRVIIFILKSTGNIIKIPKDDLVYGLLTLGKKHYNNYPKDVEFSALYIENFEIILPLLNYSSKTHFKFLNIMIEKTPEYFNQIYSDEQTVSKLKDSNLALYESNIKYYCSFYSLPKSIENLVEAEASFVLLQNLITKNMNLESKDKYLDMIYECYLNILCCPDNTENLEYIKKTENKLNLLVLIQNSLNAGYKNEKGLCQKIIIKLCEDFENSTPEIFEKIIQLVMPDFKSSPIKNLDNDLQALANLSKNTGFVKYLLSNKELMKILHNLYKDPSLSMGNRRNLATIYNYLTKNSFNIDTIMNDDPDTFTTLSKKVSDPANVIKAPENLDIAQKELDTYLNILKDVNTYNMILDRKLITQDEILQAINNYKDIHSSTKALANELQKIIDKFKANSNKKKQESNLNADKALLEELKKVINQAYSEHLEDVQKANPNFDILKDDKPDKDEENLSFIVKSSTINQRKLSVISQHLFYNPKNAVIASPISTSEKDEIASALESLLALLRIVYNNNKTATDESIIQQRKNILIESLQTLKLLTISPENHNTLVQLGLLSFTERLVEEKNPDNLPLFVEAIGNIKNCTWCESCVLLLIDSQIFNYLADEMYSFYLDPNKLQEKEENKRLFLYYNILFSNICKCQKGFDALFKKLTKKQLLVIGKNSGNIDLITSINEMLIRYLTSDNNQFDEEDYNDIIEICYKSLTLKDQSQNLMSQSLRLLGLVYGNKFNQRIGNFDIIDLVNKKWDYFKDDNDFLINATYSLSNCCKNNEKFATEIIDTGLLEKISKEINVVKPHDEINQNYIILIHNLIKNDVNNQKKLCKEEFIKLLITLLQIYKRFVNQEELTTLNSQIVALPTEEENYQSRKQDNGKRIEIILFNLFSIFEILTHYDDAMAIMRKNDFVIVMLGYMGKEYLSQENECLTVKVLKNFFEKNTKDKLLNSEIDELFAVLKSLQKKYYSIGEVIENVNLIAGDFLREFDSKYYTPRFYNLVLDGINCQDFNQNFILFSLKIIKDALIKNPSIKAEVFDASKEAMLNILRIYTNNYEMQKLCYEILTLFAQNKSHAFALVNSDIMEQIRTTLNNKDFNCTPEEKLLIRKAALNLLTYLTYDPVTCVAVCVELMEALLAEMQESQFTEDMVDVGRLLVVLTKNLKCIDCFIDYNGIEIISNCLVRFVDHQILAALCLRIIKQIAFSGAVNKNKILELKVDDKIKECISKSSDDSLPKFEGNILLKNLSYDQHATPAKKWVPEVIDDINLARKVKKDIIPLFIKGVPVKGINKKGKLKEFLLMISPDLSKVMIKKGGYNNIPSKAKYTINTSTITSIPTGHKTDIFKSMKGFFNKPPDPTLCFSVIGEGGAKTLNIVSSNKENNITNVKNLTMFVNYVKKKLSKPMVGDTVEKPKDQLPMLSGII